MIACTLLLVTLLLAALSIYALYWRRSFLLRLRCSAITFAISLAAFTFLYGAWVYLSIYCGYFFLIVFVVLLGGSLLSKGTATTPSRLRSAFNIAGAFLFALLSVLWFTGTTGEPQAVADLQLPLRHGQYYIFQGGRGLPTNLFHFSLRTAVYAIDLVKLNKVGNRASRVFSSANSDYCIFGDTIYSPCSGRVVRTRDDNPDNIPPHRERGPSNTNQVLIVTPTLYVFMAHLQYKKVFVQQGDSVAAGQPLGLAGNSGFSIEPHLHIQAHMNTHSGKAWYQEPPALIRFYGREYHLFQAIPTPGQ